MQVGFTMNDPLKKERKTNAFGERKTNAFGERGISCSMVCRLKIMGSWGSAKQSQAEVTYGYVAYLREVT